MNLVVNARDAMPNGGSIRLDLDNLDLVLPEDVPVKGMRTGSWVRIQVADTGTGIPEDVLPHIFDPFFTTKEVGMGSGLGLAQVQGLMKQHAGEVVVATAPDTGTTFSLYFPAHNSLKAIESAAASPLVRSSGDNTILLVEDNEELREITAVGLRSLGYQIIKAASGLEALAILETRAADITLILSDVVMPEMGGQALFYALQERGLNLPLVLMTGHPLDNEMEELRKRGLAGWVAKPLNLRQLSSILGLTLGVEPPAEA
ncbi:MAG: response regulator [Chloroflexi bacterium]|nr:response regulator [Chloroflexota bacterium]